jgi:hypothetical protein
VPPDPRGHAPPERYCPVTLQAESAVLARHPLDWPDQHGRIIGTHNATRCTAQTQMVGVALSTS